MPAPYELLDFGYGRKLERIGGVVVDRPSPPAESSRPRFPQLWSSANARFERTGGDRGHWHSADALPADWRFEAEGLNFRLLLRPTPHGHVGVFPEQQENWRWMADRIGSRLNAWSTSDTTARLRVLNLFAYTGGSTLAVAAAGAAVVHLDAARNVVQWARRNASASGLDAAPIRWIADDARRFVERELRRGNRYHALILDPPSYGHGARGEAWRLEQDLMPLLADCRRLLTADPAFVLLSSHSPGFGPAEVGRSVREVFADVPGAELQAKRLRLLTADGRSLDSGVAARWSAGG